MKSKQTRELMDSALEAAEQKLERAYGSGPLCDEVCEELLGVQSKWFMAHNRDELKAFYKQTLPAIREAARKLGYAIGVHGSMRRDLDLVAAPWNGDAVDKDALAHAIAIAACGITRNGPYQWTRKSESRYAVSIPVCWTAWEETNAGHIDLSVLVDRFSFTTKPDYEAVIAALRGGCNVNYEAADAIIQLQARVAELEAEQATWLASDDLIAQRAIHASAQADDARADLAAARALLRRWMDPDEPDILVHELIEATSAALAGKEGTS